MQKFEIITAFLLGCSLVFTSTTGAQAYVLMSNKLSHPKAAYYWVDPAFKKYSNAREHVLRGPLAWNPTPEIQFTKEVSVIGGADVKMQYIDKYYGDTYAVHRGSGNITFYKKWRVELTNMQRKETAAHEVGHALGLDHTQSKNDNNSLMRRYGFNNKDWVLGDDKAGIAKKY
ncbi:matrixin family metalloprotease [Listeria grandensis]|uniref:matrixin family metalloprotease n=1 Tax=Listeria grandensis TaxID=1494963 RepID=UPI0021AB8230|nr:matrixin family metalloprotease [Listeria grandensis]